MPLKQGLEVQGVADFLQEVTSRKDQPQYWFLDKPYRFVSVADFAEAFQKTQVAERTRNVVAMPYDRAACPAGSLVRYSPQTKGRLIRCVKG